MIYVKDYEDEIADFAKGLDLEFLKNKSILVTGGTGLIGSYLIDTLLEKNINIKIYAVSRNEEKFKTRFIKHKNNKNLIVVKGDLTKGFEFNHKVDYIFHLASFSDAHNYAKYPVETMLMNFLGCKSLLDVAKSKKCKRLFYASSSEIYGSSTDNMIETNHGDVDCNDIRSCYNESKRASETLCICYNYEHDVDCVIGRFCRVYGPSMLFEDSKALSQFLKNCLNNENIVLKSKGDQIFSYIYVADAVAGMLKVVKDGEVKNAYNISNDKNLKSLSEIAKTVANLSNTKVVFDLPNELEVAGYTRVKNAVLPIDKLKALGWEPKVDLDEGLKRTYNILKQVYIYNGEKEKHC